MTRILLTPLVQDATGRSSTRATLTARPFLLEQQDDTVTFNQMLVFEFDEYDVATVELDPPPINSAWTLTLYIASQQIRRVVTFDETAVDWEHLTDVDPATLTPTPVDDQLAAWEAVAKQIEGLARQPGPQGPAGPAGPKGDPGAQGAAGATGAAGPKGDPGATGAQGAPGIPGATGATGATGADSTVPGPTGPKGDTGATGPAGPKGDTGATGAAGSPGTVGDTGPQGATGPKGDTGAAGPKGDTGAQGPSGATGQTGATGAQGAQGIQGPKGDTGAQGPAGTPAPSGDSAWTAATPQNGFTQFSNGTSTFGTLRFRKLGSGEVIVRGMLNAPSSPGGVTAFTFPSGYRPANSLRLPGLNQDSFCSFAIEPSGTVAMSGSGAVAGWTSFSSIRFLADGN